MGRAAADNAVALRRASIVPAETRARRTPPDDQRNLVHSLAKGFRVLEAFTAERPTLTLSDVARTASLDPGTAFRMLNTLTMLGYVAREPDGKHFRLTLKVVDLGFHAIGRADLRDLARPILRSLVGEISEAASVGVLDGADVVYIERVRAGLTRLGVDIRIGTHIPAATGVIGHAILSHLDAADRERVAAAKPRGGGELAIQAFTAAELRRRLADIRRKGFALSESPFRNGLCILAVPVLDADAHPIAAVSVTAPAIRVSLDEFRKRALEPVRAAARDIARAVAASGTISVSV